MKSLPLLLLLLTLLYTAPLKAQDRPVYTIRGTVLQVRGEPIAGAQITLNPLPVFQAYEAAMNMAGTLSLAIQNQTVPPLLAMSPKEMQTAVKAINPGSVPPEFLAALLRLADARAAAIGFPKNAVTDASGQFTFTDVSAGQYAAMAERQGFFGFADDGSKQPRSYASASTTVGSISGSELRIAMTPGGLIAGRIRDTGGRPVANANVVAFATVYQGGVPVLQQVNAKQTDDRGEYRLFWLNPGEYVVAVLPRVNPAPVSGSNEVSVRTFYPGVAEMAAATNISVRIGEEVAAIDITPRTAMTHKIAGQIVNQLGAVPPNPDGTPAPLPVATLVLLQRNVAVPDDAGGARLIGNVNLDPNTGRFEIPGILPGVYDLYARINHPGGSLGQAGQTNAWARNPIEVIDRDLTNITMVIRPSVPVKGNVTVNGSQPGSVRFRVGLIPEGSSQKLPNYQGVVARAQTPAADGTFTIPSVSEGPYRFQALGLTEDLYLDDVKQSGGSVFDSGLLVGDRTPDPVQFSIRTDGGRLDGAVAGPNGRPVPLATVVLIPNGEQRRNAVLYKVVTADIAGRFAIRGIRPGSYKIFAWDNVPTSAYQNETFLSRYEAQGKAVGITPSSSSNVEVSVISKN